MPRRPHCNTGGSVYHALQRAVGRATLFPQDADYAAFAKVVREARDWHLVPWPKHDGDRSAFLRWLTGTHRQRSHTHDPSAGTGPP
jgi:hypothetical protein